MAGEIGLHLNRTVRLVVAAGDVGTNWVAVTLYSEQANPIYIDGFTANYAVTVAADLAITASLRLGVFRQLKIADKTLPFGTILPPFINEQILHFESRDAKIDNDFAKGFRLEPGFTYTCFLWIPNSSAAFTGSVHLYLTVRGRTEPEPAQNKATLTLRGGLSEDEGEIEALCLGQ